VGSLRGQLALGAVVLAAAIGASAAWGASLHVLISHSPNRTDSNRTRATINGIVIHGTEGRFLGSVRTLQNPRSEGSAHFVVSRRGQIVQLVPVTDVAWHSGNAWWNLHSIGIEHEGWVGRRAYTEAEYRASAQLVAYLAHRWSIPVDRTHIIGHEEVPDPFHRGRFGGASHHIDPGPFWNWRHYMGLVRRYTAQPVLPDFVSRMTLLPEPAVPHLHVVTRTRVLKATNVDVMPLRSTVDRNARVQGRALWWSGVTASTQWRRHIWKVEFAVDGKTLYTDHTWPYSFHRTIGWNSLGVPNGRHMLTVRAFGARHFRTRRSIPVRVVNPPMKLDVAGATAGGAVSGVVQLGVTPSEPVQRVALYVDGKPVSRDGSMPFTLTWDTTGVAEGAHSLLVYARGRRRGALELPVVVGNAPQFPATLSDRWSPDAQ
jgi:hypothetical protein